MAATLLCRALAVPATGRASKRDTLLEDREQSATRSEFVGPWPDLSYKHPMRGTLKGGLARSWQHGWSLVLRWPRPCPAVSCDILWHLADPVLGGSSGLNPILDPLLNLRAPVRNAFASERMVSLWFANHYRVRFGASCWDCCRCACSWRACCRLIPELSEGLLQLYLPATMQPVLPGNEGLPKLCKGGLCSCLTPNTYWGV